MAVTDRDRESDMHKLAAAFFANLSRSNCEYGGIGLDDKRPFGNSDVECDILEIIGWEPEGDDGSESCYASYQREYASELYALLPDWLEVTWTELIKIVEQHKSADADETPRSEV